MGFSVVSLIEILYFISLRPYCAKRRYVQKNIKIVKQIEPGNRVWHIENDADSKLLSKSAWTQSTASVIKPSVVGQSLLPQIKGSINNFGRKYVDAFKAKFNNDEVVSSKNYEHSEQKRRYPYTE